jgi:Flp pilus assembly protein TadD
MTPSRALAAAALLCLASCATAHRARPDGVSGVRLTVARELIERRQYGDALAAIQQIHESTGRSAGTLTLRSLAYRGQGLPEDAQADLREALRLNPDYAPAHAGLAILHDEARRFGEGDNHHRRAVELDPQNASYLNDWGYALYQQGRLQDALVRFQKAVSLDPLPARYHNNLGFAYARAGDFTRAAQQFRVGGSPAEAANNLGYAYELAGNLPQAFDAYVEAVKLGPGLERARANLEDVARKLKREVPPKPAAVKVSSGERAP